MKSQPSIMYARDGRIFIEETIDDAWGLAGMCPESDGWTRDLVATIIEAERQAGL